MFTRTPPARIDALLGRTFDAVLFDNDGTLISSITAVKAAWSQWAREYQIRPYRLLHIHGLTTAEIVRDFVPPERFDEALARIRDLEENSSVPVAALPGSVAALTAVGDRGAIVTSAFKVLFDKRAEQAGLPVPATVVTADDIVRGKPNPEPYLLAAERLGADPHRCLVVEDAPAGIEAGQAAGAATLGVASHRAGRLDADGIVPDLSHVTFVPAPGGVTLAAAAR